MSVRNITVLALGGAGCRVMRELAGSSAAVGLRLLAADTDREALAASGLAPESRLLAGELWRNGRGCGGRELDGQRAFAHERSQLEKLLSGSEALIVVAGLGGGAGTGGVSVIPGICSKLRVPALFLLTLPFTLEGHSRRKLAERTLEGELISVADAVIALPNDLLFSSLDAATPLAEAFEAADRELARTVLALVALLGAENLFNADFSGFSALLKRRKSFCSLGVGIAGAEVVPEKRVATAMDSLLSSPWCGGASRLLEADAILLSLLSGPGLSIGETRATLEEACRHLNPEAELLVAASSSPEWEGMLQLTALAIKFDERAELPVPEVQPRRGRSRRAAAPEENGAVQLTLSLDPVDKGIMERTTPVHWNNEDLDIPTFVRRRIVIDNGRGEGARK